MLRAGQSRVGRLESVHTLRAPTEPLTTVEDVKQVLLVALVKPRPARKSLPANRLAAQQGRLAPIGCRACRRRQSGASRRRGRQKTASIETVPHGCLLGCKSTVGPVRSFHDTYWSLAGIPDERGRDTHQVGLCLAVPRDP